MKNLFLAILLLAAFGFLLVPAQASTIIIGYAAANGQLPSTWNTLTSVNVTNQSLLDINGLSTGISITTVNSGGATGKEGFYPAAGESTPGGSPVGPNVTPSVLIPFVSANLGSMWAKGASNAVTLSGLTSGTDYTLTLFYVNGNTGTTTDYTLTSYGTADVTFASLNGKTNASSSQTIANVAVLSNVTANGSGVISFTATPDASNSSGVGYLAFIEIDTASVPEPSTIAFVGLGVFGLALVGFRRRWVA